MYRDRSMGKERFDRLFEIFAAAGKELFLVGGCVRDLLMSRTPKDFDFATNAQPSETREILQRGGMRAIPIGEAFGTIATRLGVDEIEITSYRVKESYKKGSRHPEVVFGERLEEDLSRRDLTINAMAMDRAGVVVDPFGGEGDLRAGRLRVPGGGFEKTLEIFGDDPLRMLRVGRFIARYGFSADDATTQAARACAGLLRDVSRERWQSEFDRLLPGDEIARGLEWLAEVGVLEVCLPEVVAGDRFEAALALVELLPPTSLLRWGGLLHAVEDVGEGRRTRAEVVEEIGRRFRFSNNMRDRLVYLVASQRRPTQEDVVDRIAARRWLLDAGPLRDDVLTLSHARATIYREDALMGARRARLEALREELSGRGDLAPLLPKGLGHRLLGELGVERGPALGALIVWLKECIITERLPNGADARVYLDAARVHLTEAVR